MIYMYDLEAIGFFKALLLQVLLHCLLLLSSIPHHYLDSIHQHGAFQDLSIISKTLPGDSNALICDNFTANEGQIVLGLIVMGLSITLSLRTYWSWYAGAASCNAIMALDGYVGLFAFYRPHHVHWHLP